MSGIALSPSEKNIERVVQAVRQLLEGRSNAGGTVTLRAGQTTTVVAAPNCGIGANIFLTPQTAHAAALSPLPYVPPGNVGLGTFTIVHPSSAEIDLTFGWEARG